MSGAVLGSLQYQRIVPHLVSCGQSLADHASVGIEVYGTMPLSPLETSVYITVCVAGSSVMLKRIANRSGAVVRTWHRNKGRKEDLDPQPVDMTMSARKNTAVSPWVHPSPCGYRLTGGKALGFTS